MKVSGSGREELARLIAEGRVLPPERAELMIPQRVRLESGSVEELVREQRKPRNCGLQVIDTRS